MSAWFFAASSPATIGALRPHRDVLRPSPLAGFDWRPVTGRDRAGLSAERLLGVHETLAGPTITITGTGVGPPHQSTMRQGYDRVSFLGHAAGSDSCHWLLGAGWGG